ncbi:MAG: hypothetical protein ACFFF4_01980 [Candidatus Thorarchaeota archaeon]
MAIYENEEFDVLLENRLNLQFSIGVIGVIIGIVSGGLSRFYTILIQTTPPSAWYNFVALYIIQNILSLLGYLFVMVGILALFRKHNFKYMWVFVFLILQNLLFIMYTPYLLQWIVATSEDFVVYVYFSLARSLLIIFIFAALTFSISHSVRNKFLIWSLILGSFLILGFNYLLWYLLYGVGPLINAQPLTVIPYQLGTYLFGMIFNIFELLLFMDERKYTMSSYHETMVINGEFDI